MITYDDLNGLEKVLIRSMDSLTHTEYVRKPKMTVYDLLDDAYEHGVDYEVITKAYLNEKRNNFGKAFNELYSGFYAFVSRSEVIRIGACSNAYNRMQVYKNGRGRTVQMNEHNSWITFDELLFFPCTKEEALEIESRFLFEWNFKYNTHMNNTLDKEIRTTVKLIPIKFTPDVSFESEVLVEAA